MLIHTIQIAGDIRVRGVVNATRKSDSRRYTACVVATITERTLEIKAAAKVAAEAELVDWRAKLAARLAQHGMTVEQAKGWAQDAETKWFGRDDTTSKAFDGPYWKASDQARKELGRICNDDKVSKRAHEIMVSRGFADPWDYAKNPCGIVQAAGSVEGLEETLAAWKPPVLGAQGVVSWHANVANARKGLDAHRYLAEKYGKKLEIRTDIEVRETVKRAKKSA